MYRWSDEQLMMRDAVRQFIEAEIKPNVEELEHGDTPPYDILRKLFATFGMDADGPRPLQAPDRVREGRWPRPWPRARPRPSGPAREGGGDAVAHADPDHRAVPLLPGHGHGHGREHGPHRRRPSTAGAPSPRRSGGSPTCSPWTRSAPGPSPSPTRAPTPSARCCPPPAATATSTCSTARRRSSPTAPTPTPSCSSASSTRATRRPSARSCSFVLDTGMPGLEQSKPLRKMGMHSLAHRRAVPHRRAGRAATA